jgi:hypothetical protein
MVLAKSKECSNLAIGKKFESESLIVRTAPPFSLSDRKVRDRRTLSGSRKLGKTLTSRIRIRAPNGSESFDAKKRPRDSQE